MNYLVGVTGWRESLVQGISTMQIVSTAVRIRNHISDRSKYGKRVAVARRVPAYRSSSPIEFAYYIHTYIHT